MLGKLRSHAAGNLVGYVALFVALGGTASALAANTVGTLQLRSFAVRNSDVGTLAVSNSKLGNDSVSARTLRNPIVRERSIRVEPGATTATQSFCGAGEAVLAGGTRWLREGSGNAYDGPGVTTGYLRLVPLPGADGVRARGNNTTALQLRLVVQALCLP